MPKTENRHFDIKLLSEKLETTENQLMEEKDKLKSMEALLQREIEDSDRMKAEGERERRELNQMIRTLEDKIPMTNENHTPADSLDDFFKHLAQGLPNIHPTNTPHELELTIDVTQEKADRTVENISNEVKKETTITDDTAASVRFSCQCR